MNTIVIFYSYSGNTAKYAEELAKTESADIYEVKDQKPLGKFKAYTAGCFKAMTHGTFPITPIAIDFGKYDKFIVCAPIWAGSPAPQINNVFDLLPQGSDIELHMISGSGESSKDKICEWLKGKGLNITKYIDKKSKEI
jgi:Multimeric flavodoxin WrbA